MLYILLNVARRLGSVVVVVAEAMVIFFSGIQLHVQNYLDMVLWYLLSKGTSTGKGLLYEPIPRYSRPSVTNIQPGKDSMTAGQTDRRTDGRTMRPVRCGFILNRGSMSDILNYWRYFVIFCNMYNESLIEFEKVIIQL